MGPRQSHGGDPEGEGSLIVGDPSVHDSHRFSPSRKPWFATMRKLMVLENWVKVKSSKLNVCYISSRHYNKEIIKLKFLEGL